MVVLLVVAATPRFLDAVVGCGDNIPQEDLPTDYLKAVLWSIAIGLSIFIWPVSPQNKKCLLIGWLGKVVIALGVMLFYEGHYGLDAYMYFEESQKTAFSFASFLTSGDAPGTRNIINIASLNNYLVPDSYHAQKVTFALIGFLGVFLFYKSAVAFFRTDSPKLFYLIAFFPGILFWSTILGKEPVVFFAISLYVYGTVHWHLKGRYRYFLVIAAGIYLGLLIRSWLGPIMVLPLVLLFLTSSVNRAVKFALMVLTAVVLIVSAGPMMEKFKIQAFEDVLTAADKTTQGFVHTAGGSTQQLDVDLTSPAGVIKFLPVAAFTALFRPLPGEVMNPFGLLAGLESAILLFLLYRSIRRTKRRELAEPLVLWSVSFVVIWALVNGIVSSTNFGVGVRYKLQILPVLLGVLVYLSRDRGAESSAATDYAVGQVVPAGGNNDTC